MRKKFWLTSIITSCFVILFGMYTSAFATSLEVVSFNIQFLGHFKNRDNPALAKLLSPYDLIFIQELVAPPFSGQYPDGTSYKNDKEAQAFFNAMTVEGFSYVLSEEDTGTGPENHKQSSATEWFVAFYKPNRVTPAESLPHGFIANDRSDNPDYERVPYAFSFRAGNSDLVFISVHLQPGGSSKKRTRRAHEFKSIFKWIDKQNGPEKDYVILGDMNIEDCEELNSILPKGFTSLNGSCIPTNTNPKGPKPYDHVLYNLEYSANEMHKNQQFKVINLIDEMRKYWKESDRPYIGDPYQRKEFRMKYSDHHPIAFKVATSEADDD